jgi:hypothetical protein
MNNAMQPPVNNPRNFIGLFKDRKIYGDEGMKTLVKIITNEKRSTM